MNRRLGSFRSLWSFRQADEDVLLPRSLVIALAIPLALILLFFLTLPVIYLFFVLTPSKLFATLKSAMLLQALGLSLLTTVISAICILLLGTPLAYLLARYSFPQKGLIVMLVDMPMVIPPAVAGIGLIMAFGRRGLVGGALDHMGIHLSFSMAAVVMAQVFISAPFYIRSARFGFAMGIRDLELMARTLGAGTWMTVKEVTLPLVAPYLVSGLLTSWARALGEFGATIMFAGNFPGRTQTMPVAIFTAMNQDLAVAVVTADVLLIMSLVLIGITRLLPSGRNSLV